MSVEAVSNELLKFSKAEVPKLNGAYSPNIKDTLGGKTDASQKSQKTDSGIEGERRLTGSDHGNLASSEGQKYSKVMAEKAVENANNRIKATRTRAKFEYNEDIDRITITITDKDDEVIREIPPEATQKVLERIHTFSGMLVDEEI